MFGEWTYDKPTEAGWYAVNRGDVVTEQSFEVARLDSMGIIHFVNGVSMEVADMYSDFQFSRIDINELNKG